MTVWKKQRISHVVSFELILCHTPLSLDKTESEYGTGKGKLFRCVMIFIIFFRANNVKAAYQGWEIIKHFTFILYLAILYEMNVSMFVHVLVESHLRNKFVQSMLGE